MSININKLKLQVRPNVFFAVYTYVPLCSYVKSLVIAKTDDVMHMLSFLHVHVGLLNLSIDDIRSTTYLKMIIFSKCVDVV